MKEAYKHGSSVHTYDPGRPLPFFQFFGAKRGDNKVAEKKL